MAQVENNLAFSDIFSKISEPSKKILIEENCVHEIVFSRMTNDEIKSFNFSEDDQSLMKLIALQCRVLDRHAVDPKVRLEMPKNQITDIFPIKSKVTLRALKKASLLFPAKLYLFTSMEEVSELFRKYPSIPKTDQQNIFVGMAIGKYAAKNGK